MKKLPEALTPDVVLSPEQLLEQIKNPMRDILRTEIDDDMDPERISMLLKARRNNLYWKGEHYHALTISPTGQMTFTPIGTATAVNPSTGNADPNDGDVYDSSINLYRGLGRKFIAVVGNKPPNCAAVADNPDDQVSADSAVEADKANRLLDSRWKMAPLNERICLGMWKSGTLFGYTRWVTNAQKYGRETVPQFEMQEQTIEPAGRDCPNCGQRTPEPEAESDPESGFVSAPADTIPCQSCGTPLGPETISPEVKAQVPVQTGVQQYDNGFVEHDVYDVLSVTVPSETVDIDECSWLRLEVDMHRGKVLQLFPQLRTKIAQQDNAMASGASGSSQTGVLARQERDSPNSYHYQRKNKITVTQYWLTPIMYELFEDQVIREQIQQRFPDGCRVAMVMDEVVDIEAEKLADHWDACKPDTWDLIHADCIAQDFNDIQDIINDITNITKETLTRGVPQSLGDPQVIDFEAMGRSSMRPNEIYPAKAAPGKSLKDALVSMPKGEVSDQAVPFKADMLATGQNVTGVLPSIYGGDGVSQTAHEAEMKRNQALQQLNIPWKALREYWSSVRTKAIKIMAQYSARIEFAPGDAKSGIPAAPIDFSKLQLPGWHLEADEAFPMTHGQKRDQLNNTLQNPAAVELFGLNHPLNKPMIHDILGFPDMYIPMYDLVIYIQQKIRELSREQPIQQPDPMTGQVETIPSLGGGPADIDPLIEDNHQLIVEIIKSYLVSRAGQSLQKTNPMGFENVRQYALLHMKIQAQQEALAAQQAAAAQAESAPPDQGHAPGKKEKGGKPGPKGGSPRGGPGDNGGPPSSSSLPPSGGGPPAAPGPGPNGPGGPVVTP